MAERKKPKQTKGILLSKAVLTGIIISSSNKLSKA